MPYGVVHFHCPCPSLCIHIHACINTDNRCCNICKFFFEGEKDFDELTIDELNMWLLSKEMPAKDCDCIRGELPKIL